MGKAVRSMPRRHWRLFLQLRIQLFELDHERCKQTLTYSALSTCQFIARGSCIVVIMIPGRIKTNKIGDWAVLHVQQLGAMENRKVDRDGDLRPT